MHEFLISCGFIQSDTNGNVYVYRKGGEVCSLALYVDDTLLAGSTLQIIHEVKQLLSAEFNMSDLGAASFFLGVQVMVDTVLGTVTLLQSHYITKLLEKFNMLNSKPASTPAAVGAILSKDQCPKTPQEEEEMKDVPYRTLVGCLLWISN